MISKCLAARRAEPLDEIRLYELRHRADGNRRCDVDLLVDVAPGVGLFELGRCQSELQALLGARVDLEPAADLKPGVARDVLAEASAL